MAALFSANVERPSTGVALFSIARMVPADPSGGRHKATTLTNDIQDAVSAWEEGALTHSEFVMRMLAGLQTLPPAERPSVLEKLSTHADEGVRAAASECRKSFCTTRR